jgi:hypothetical protein
VSGSVDRALLFLAAFAIGSTVAMAVLTYAIAKVGRTLNARTIERAQLALAFGAALLGGYWLVG